MADTLYELQGKLSIDTSEANEKVDGAVEHAHGATSKFASILQGIGQGVGQGLVLMATKLTAFIGDAVSRVDTLDNANKVFADMGFTAEQTTAMMDNLQKSIHGLPTSLDNAVQGVQLLAGATGDLGGSEKIYSAMNDAVLGFGGTADQAQSAVVQLSQSLANGKIDGQTWETMINDGLGPALGKIAQQMGITTKDLQEGLSKGKISTKQFTDALVDMDQKGGAGMTSFHSMALDMTQGIGTSFANMRTAITRGVGDIISALNGDGLISSVISKFGSTVESGLKAASKQISNVMDNIKQLYQSLKDNGVMTSFESAWNSIKSALENVGKAVKDFFGAITGGAKSADIITGISKALAEVASFAVDAAEKFNEFTKGLSKGFQEAGKIVGGIISQIVSDAKQLWENLKDNGTIDKLKASFNNVKDAVGDVISIVKQVISNIENMASGSDIVERLSTAFQVAAGVIETVTGAIKDFLGWLTSGSTGAKIFEGAIAAVVAGLVALKASLAIQSAFGWLKELPGQFKNIVNGLNDGAAAGKAFRQVLASGSLSEVVTMVAAMATKFLELTKAQGLATAAQWLFDAALDANPIGVIVMAIAAGVAALVGLGLAFKAAYDHIKPFHDAVQGLGAILGTIFKVGIDVVVTSLKLLGEVIGTLVGAGINIFKSAISGVVDVLKTLWDSVKNFPVIKQLGEAFEDVKKVLGVIGAGISAFTSNLNGVKNAQKEVTDATKKHSDALKELKDAQDKANQSQEDAKRALLDAQQADLNVKNAQKAYNDAVAEYGANSDEAKQASIDLQNATMDKADADKKAKKAADDHNKALDNVNKAQKDTKKSSDDLKKAHADMANAEKNDVSKKIEDAWKNIKKNTEDGVKNLTKGIKDFGDSLSKNVKAGVKSAGDELTKGLANWVKSLGDKVTAMGKSLKDGWDKMTGTVKKANDDINKAISDAFTGIWKFIQNISNNISKFFQNVWNDISDTFKNAWNEISNTVTNIANNIWNFIQQIFNNIKNFYQNIWNDISNVFKNVWNNISNTVTNVANNIWNFIQQIFNNIKNFFQSVWSNISSIVSGFINGISSNISGVFNGISGFIGGIMSSISGIISGGWNAISGSINNIVGGIGSFIHGVFQDIQNTVNNVIGSIQNAANIIGGIVGNVKKTISGVTNMVGKIVGHAAGGIVTRPTVIGVDKAQNVHIAGEAGAEAILPLNPETLSGIGQGISQFMNDQSGQVADVLNQNTSLLQQVLQAILNQDFSPSIVLNDNTLVGKVINKIDKGLGTNNKMKLRGRTV